MHQDPIAKSQRLTDAAGTVASSIELDPWGGETSRIANSALQPRKYTTYERDANGGDEAMFRRYEGRWNRFAQPDPYDGSYDFSDPQSFNRYSYVLNDPVNFVDPRGLDDPTFGLGPPPPPPSPSDPTFGLGDPPPPPGTEDGGVERVWTWAPYWDTLPRLFEGGMAMPLVSPHESSGGTLLPIRELNHPQQKNGPFHDPNSQFCQSLLKKINNIRKDIVKRIDEFMKDPQNLPMFRQGARLSEDGFGHLKIIMDAHDNFQRRIQEYMDKCGGPPPGVPVSRSPTENPGFNRDAATKAVAVTGTAVVVYFVIRTILRVVFPPSNLLPVP